MLKVIRILSAVVFVSTLATQPFAYRINEFAGRKIAQDGVLARDAAIMPPLCVTRDSVGAIYICGTSNGALYRVSPDNQLTTVFGSGVAGFRSGGPLDFGDGGPAIEAHGVPVDVAVDADGNIYFVQSRSSRVRKIAPDGTVTTIAGGSVDGFSGDGGPAIDARLLFPQSIAIGPNGSLYFSDAGNGRIRRIGLDGVIETIAGGGDGQFGDGSQATQVQLLSPMGLDIDSEGNVFFAELRAHRIAKIATDGTISTVAGSGLQGFAGDGGPALLAFLNFPRDVAVDSDGSLYIADRDNHRIRKVSSDGTISSIAGNGTAGFSGNGGSATEAQLNLPLAVTLEPGGTVLVADFRNAAIRRVWPSGVITTVAGGPRFRNETGPASEAAFYFPNGVILDPDGNPLVVDSFNHVIRRVNPDQTLETAVGIGVQGASASDSLTPQIALGWPRDAAYDSQGNLYITENSSSWVRIVEPSGNTRVFLGSGERGVDFSPFPRDLQLSFPRGLAIDADDNLYVTDSSNHRILRVRRGLVDLFAGTRQAGFSGDGGSARLAMLNSPRGMAFDAQGNLYVADTFNHRIRKITPDVQITTFAGTGTKGFAGDGGPASAAWLNEPHRLKFDAEGYLYVADSYNHVIRMITPAGIIHTIAGTPGDGGDEGDGVAALNAKLNLPKGLDIRPNGDIIFSDNDNHRVRMLRPQPRLVDSSVVNAAGFKPLIAPGSIASLFGTNLAGKSEAAASSPLPTNLAFSRITISDSVGTVHEAGQFFASKTQSNFYVPPDVAVGPATLKLIRDNGAEAETTVEIAAVAPGIFSTGSYLRVRADGSRESGLTTTPIDLGAEGDQVFLTLFASGLRNRSALTAVSVTIGGESISVRFADPQGQFLGLDQLDIGPLPRALVGHGPAALLVSVDGIAANPLSVSLQ